MLRRIKLIYPAHLVDRPILYGMIKRFDIVTNIRAANITAEEGWLVVELNGESEQLEAALAWVADQGVQVEPLATD